MPLENVQEGLYKNKLQGSDNQEVNRDEVTPCFQRLRTMVRQHVDQTIRTRNLKARNERFETGALVKNHNGRNVSVERKVGECFQWKATGQSSNPETPVVLTTGPILIKEHNHPLLL